ncbi:hypothetical protein PC116_g5944 [Phytophthora cactorum]|uniref:Uncharacterized protein n=1 Tax=Phytophthora cactorum TaxID=29920 RepID=A0A8T1GJ22_9STRA|nr:hypothetical protein PC112_g3301 [Phytophthora cactorum]KAG2927375.1 hypothetical protein PC114_g3487 [Phytophthora cactorum]KAG2940804.1 hypothetical protein PC115_g2321 [Phytophthora cactorum]KAG2952453.1 hypothetical protein PC117_g2773 [Phytophthora cactorum]KAG2995584.1 hypothetical protein PC118_g2915 [Phytophthora cactorum]
MGTTKRKRGQPAFCCLNAHDSTVGDSDSLYCAHIARCNSERFVHDVEGRKKRWRQRSLLISASQSWER